MKFQIREGLLYLPITVTYKRDISLTAIIDTGAAKSAFHIDLSDIDVFRSPARLVDMVGIGGSQETFTQITDREKIGPVNIDNVEVQFCDIETNFGFQGIIGTDLLNHISAVIDFKHQTLEFEIDT